MNSLSELASEVLRLTQTVQRLEHSVKDVARTVTTSITTLAPAPLIVKKPIPVTMQVTEEDTIASFLEANVSASGDTPQEAFHNLCDILIAKIQLFESLPPEKLGREPQRQFAVIREFVAKG